MTGRPTLPDDVWLQIMDHSLDSSFMPCRVSSNLKRCRHQLGLCVYREPVYDFRSRAIALSSVNRQLRSLLLSAVFRSFFVSDVISTHNLKRNPAVAFNSDDALQKSLALERSYSRVDRILHHANLCAHIRTLYIDGWDMWVAPPSPTRKYSETPLQRSMHRWSRSCQKLLTRLTNLEGIVIKRSLLSQSTMGILHRLPNLKIIHLVASSTFINHEYTKPASAASAVDTIQYIPDFVRSNVGTLTVPFIMPFHDSSTLTLTALEFFFCGVDGEENLVPEPGLHFPALRTISIQMLGTNKAVDSVALSDKVEQFFRAHPAVNDLRIPPPSSDRTKWFERLVEVERGLLPNITSAWGAQSHCSALGKGRRIRDFHIFLSSLVHLSNMDCHDLAEVTNATRIRLWLIQLIPNPNGYNLRPEHSLLGSTLLPLNESIEELTWKTPEEEVSADLQIIREDFTKHLHLYPNLRSIEIYIRDEVHPTHNTSLGSGSSCRRPTDHPVLGDTSDLAIRGHPALERVQIVSSGTWVWGGRRGWEYCF